MLVILVLLLLLLLYSHITTAVPVYPPPAVLGIGAVYSMNRSSTAAVGPAVSPNGIKSFKSPVFEYNFLNNTCAAALPQLQDSPKTAQEGAT